MKPSGWSPLLFREEAAVIVAVHEGKYGRNTVSSDHFKRLRRRSPLLSMPMLGNVLKSHVFPSDGRRTQKDAISCCGSPSSSVLSSTTKKTR